MCVGYNRFKSHMYIRFLCDERLWGKLIRLMEFFDLIFEYSIYKYWISSRVFLLVRRIDAVLDLLLLKNKCRIFIMFMDRLNWMFSLQKTCSNLDENIRFGKLEYQMCFQQHIYMYIYLKWFSFNFVIDILLKIIYICIQLL